MKHIKVVIGESYLWLKRVTIPEYIRNTNGITKVIVNKLPMRIETYGGMVIYFVSIEHYPRWCKGRTYWMDGEKYHSGYLVKEQENE